MILPLLALSCAPKMPVDMAPLAEVPTSEKALIQMVTELNERYEQTRELAFERTEGTDNIAELLSGYSDPEARGSYAKSGLRRWLIVSSFSETATEMDCYVRFFDVRGDMTIIDDFTIATDDKNLWLMNNNHSYIMTCNQDSCGIQHTGETLRDAPFIPELHGIADAICIQFQTAPLTHQ